MASNSPAQKKCRTWPPQSLKREQSGNKEPAPVFPEGNGNSKTGTTEAQATQADRAAASVNGSKPQSCGNGRQPKRSESALSP